MRVCDAFFRRGLRCMDRMIPDWPSPDVEPGQFGFISVYGSFSP